MRRLVLAMVLLFCLCGVSQAWLGDHTQEWIYITVQGPYWNNSQLYIAVMTNSGQVPYSDSLDLATVTYKFKHIPDRSKFNLLRECFGMESIAPSQIGDLFGVPVKIVYAYAWNTGPIVHTAQEFFAAFSAGLIKQNSVTLNIVE